MTRRQGKCSCGAVQFTVSGKPETLGAFWKPGALVVTQGAEHIATFNRTAKSCRKWCKVCGSYLYMDHAGIGLTDLYAALVRSLAVN